MPLPTLQMHCVERNEGELNFITRPRVGKIGLSARERGTRDGCVTWSRCGNLCPGCRQPASKQRRKPRKRLSEIHLCQGDSGMAGFREKDGMLTDGMRQHDRISRPGRGPPRSCVMLGCARLVADIEILPRRQRGSIGLRPSDAASVATVCSSPHRLERGDMAGGLDADGGSAEAAVQQSETVRVIGQRREQRVIVWTIEGRNAGSCIIRCDFEDPAQKVAVDVVGRNMPVLPT
ncbi:hypothetical protein AB4305_03465 [Nocardia sp. 2YAB30]